MPARKPARKLRVGVVSSVGGHLSEVLELLPELLPHELFFVLNDEAPWRRELESFRRYRIVHAERDARLLINLVEAARILRRERPDVLISMGASPAVPFFGLGRLLGVRTIFIESFAAVEKPTLTGRLLHGVAHHFFVQWPELLKVLPRARYVGPIFTPPAQAAAPPPIAEPTELLVTVGSSERPFRRLLGWLDGLAARGALPARRLIQSATPAQHLPTVPFLPAALLEAELRTAARIVCHGGAGILGACLKWGRHPIVVPRRAAFGEVVNDHQLMLCRALRARRLITVCETEEELAAALIAKTPPPSGDALSSELRPSVAKLLQEVALAL
jgi:beta-1,4-N-acetylglucosaminyltransferase